MEYKTIAGPIGLTAENGEDYNEAVKKYAAIIDHNAVGGWELAWIQQIPVTKITPNVGGILGVTAICAGIGAAIGAANASYREIMGAIIAGIVIGGGIGAAIGYATCKKKVTEFFNMLVFSKKN